ncbi:phage head-tail adaptor, putative, SPP1 family [Poseidonocella pacifica]|uniref:Phage head-tail adaptor, putative, SPP1 family n=1 Tax=Poseidonocella pacifica TaxID=871651 RepID=A0A1I0VR13_9RHOB|nr:head-tail adaptor protein [Poseidonocella pacifica]SFA78116.1 phage head-tail adaptor, putative, SPP1 family [Poseidonocella pacifica]
MSGISLNRPLILETLERSEDGAGGFTEEWRALGTLWAEVRARSGRETSGTTMPRATVPYVVTVRATPVGYSSRPRAGQRFRDTTRIFPILAVADDDPGRRYLTCFTEEETVS